MSSPIEQARRVLQIEANAILALKDRIGASFEQAVKMVMSCKGKVIVAGMGKSGQICRKIAATLASTGTPAFFLHPAEGIHGDVGMIAKGDLVLGISHSGETAELVKILPLVKRLDVPIIAITGNTKSSLAKASDIVLDASIQEEACPMGLAPTASTTATLAMGDALAVAVLKARGFKEDDFALLHPGGALGRKLLMTVEDLMKVGDAVPLVKDTADMKETLLEMTSKRLGATGVVDGQGRLIGVITDGDLRRHLNKRDDFFTQSAADIMSSKPKTIRKRELVGKATHTLETHKITSLFIVDEKGYPTGIIHLHDILETKVI